jgi:hypothetical protein
MFATSPDLLNWTKVSEDHRFSQDPRWYKPAAASLPGFFIDQGNGNAECVSFARGRTLLGTIALDAVDSPMISRQTVDRGLDFGEMQAFSVLLSSDMMEVYVNDYLMILARVRNTGMLGWRNAEGPHGVRDVRVWGSGDATGIPRPGP